MVAASLLAWTNLGTGLEGGYDMSGAMLEGVDELRESGQVSTEIMRKGGGSALLGAAGVGLFWANMNLRRAVKQEAEVNNADDKSQGRE